MLTNPMGMVYGIIVVAALLDAESVRSEHYADTVGGVAIALLLVWLSHAYADYAGHRLHRRESLQLKDLGEALLRGAAVLVGGAVPFLCLVLCWAAGASLGTGVNVGIYSAVGVLLAIELIAAWRAKLSGLALLIQSGFGAVLGALVIALKLLLH